MGDSNTLSPFVVLAQRRVKEGRLDRFLEADDALMRDASGAEGFDTVHVLQSVEEPRFVTHFEVWASQDAHDRYVMGSAHGDFEDAIAGLVEHVEDPRHYAVFRTYRGGSDPDGSVSGEASGDGAAPRRSAPRPEAERISPVNPAAASGEVGARLDALPPLRFFGVVAHAEAAFEPFMRLADALMNRGRLHTRLRELAVLAIAYFERADYERVQHEALAAEAGVTEEQRKAIRGGAFEAPILNDDERLVLRFVRSWWERGVVPEELFADARERFGPDGTTELLLVCGFYLMAARLMTNAGLAPDDPPGSAFSMSE